MDDLDTREVFERMDDFERVDFLFNQLENSYDIIFQLQQKVEHNAKTSAIQMSMIEMLIEESGYYSKQLGGYGQKPELLDKLKKHIEADFDVSTKTFERLKKNGEIKVTTIGGSDYVAKKDMLDRLGLNE